MTGFDVVATTPVVLVDDVEEAAAHVRDYCALYIGGMGSREQNFYNQLACRMGFEEDAARIQDLYLAGRPPRGRGGRAPRVHRRDGPAGLAASGSPDDSAATRRPASRRSPSPSVGA